MTALTITNPLDDPSPWDSITLKKGSTKYTWPSDPSYGLVEWSSFKDAVKIDKKAKAGAAKSRNTSTGGDNVQGSFKFRVNPDLPDALSSLAAILDVLKAGAGPFAIENHPWAQLTGVRGFLVESVEPQPPHETPGELAITISYVQVDPDAQEGKGGNVSKTARQKAADEWNAALQATLLTQQLSLIAGQDADDRARKSKAPGESRQAKKFGSVLVGTEDIGKTTKQPQSQNPPGTASGTVGS